MEVVDRDEAIMYVISGLNIPLKLNAATLIPGLHCPYHWAGKLGAQPAEGLVTHADDELYEKRGKKGGIYSIQCEMRSGSIARHTPRGKFYLNGSARPNFASPHHQEKVLSDT